jgi:hypothetical protein
MTLQAATQKTFLSLLLIVMLAAPTKLWAQQFEIDTTGFFNDNRGEVTHPRLLAAAGPKADIETDVKVKSDNDIVLHEKVSVAKVKHAAGKYNRTSGVVKADPLSTRLYGSAWDTLNVRVRRTEILSGSDTSFINLANLEDSSLFVFPYKGKILSPFGYRGRHFHAGVDIKLNHGDPVVCAFDGVVRMAKYYSGYGNAVVVRHSNGLETLYGHLSKIEVRVNQELKAGDLIGLGGRTGRATCDHLHFETRYLGAAFNPRQFIDLDNYCLTKNILPITRHTFGRTKDFLPTALNEGSDNDSIPASASSSRHSHAKLIKTKGGKYCKIKSGETLYAIALRHNTTVKDLCSLNRISKNKTLKIGTRLRLK